MVRFLKSLAATLGAIIVIWALISICAAIHEDNERRIMHEQMMIEGKWP